jgi:His/Glu/Gln/Arg/opine family amino acid ABC transporter permease subunit
MQYTLVAVFVGCFIALPICFMRMSRFKSLNLIATIYISVIKGTPVVVQLSIWYFAFTQLRGWQISAFTAGAFTFAINSSAYLAEVIRSGINAIDPGQAEAARVIGLTKKDTFFGIILPQALSNITPAIVGEIIALTKETAIIGFIGVADLARRAQLVATTSDCVWPMLAAGTVYYCLTVGISCLYSFIKRSKRVKNYKYSIE